MAKNAPPTLNTATLVSSRSTIAGSFGTSASARFTSIQSDTASVHHAGLQSGGFGHHVVIPRRVEDELDVELRQRRDEAQLVSHVLHEDLTHAAARCRERHLHLDAARTVAVR